MSNDTEHTVLAENKRVAGDFLRALGRRDMEALDELFHDDGTFYGPSRRNEQSKEEFFAALEWLWTRLQDGLTIVPGQFTAEDDRVSVLAEGHAVTIEGDPYHNVYHFWFQIKDGKMYRGREYSDTHLIWTVLRRA